MRENDNLTKIHLFDCEIGRECARDLALALSQRQVNSLESLGFGRNNLGDEGFVDIIQALVTQPQPELYYLGDVQATTSGGLVAMHWVPF